jgi:hypothetical protein
MPRAIRSSPRDHSATSCSLSPVADADDDSGSRSDRAGRAKIKLAKQAQRAGRLPGHFDPAG